MAMAMAMAMAMWMAVLSMVCDVMQAAKVTSMWRVLVRSSLQSHSMDHSNNGDGVTPTNTTEWWLMSKVQRRGGG
jgi:hypothetical protein